MKIKLITRAWISRVMLCLAPKSKDEDTRRSEYILNIILALSISALLVLGLTIIWNEINIGENYSGINPMLFITIILMYLGLFKLSKAGWIYTASALLVSLDAIGTIYTGWKWGASLPETLLLTVLVIETASVLIGSTMGFITAGTMIIILTILGIHESTYLNVPDWRYDQITVTDVITYSIMFLFISFIAWIANNEIDRSLKRARQSEKLLIVERDSLEEKVSTRTRELVITQQKIFTEAEHTIHVGELARGVMHDMMSPLSAINLYIEELDKDCQDEISRKKLIDQATKASVRMKEFMESVRHHIDPRSVNNGSVTNILDEIRIVKDILAHKARTTNVKIVVCINKNEQAIDSSRSINIQCPSIRIHQIFLNLVSNSIDACKYKNQIDQHGHIINININQDLSNLDISISDTGCGMTEKQLEKLFCESISTKLGGTGIGLKTVHSIVTKELNGKLEVRSTVGIGTTFNITIPYQNNGISNTTDQKKSIHSIR